MLMESSGLFPRKKKKKWMCEHTFIHTLAYSCSWQLTPTPHHHCPPCAFSCGSSPDVNLCLVSCCLAPLVSCEDVKNHHPWIAGVLFWPVVLLWSCLTVHLKSAYNCSESFSPGYQATGALLHFCCSLFLLWYFEFPVELYVQLC